MADLTNCCAIFNHPFVYPFVSLRLLLFIEKQLLLISSLHQLVHQSISEVCQCHTAGIAKVIDSEFPS